MEYAPWAIFNWMMPLACFIMAIVGVTLADSNGVSFLKKRRLAKKEA